MTFILFDLQAVIYKYSEEKDKEDGTDAADGLCQNKNTGALSSGIPVLCSSFLQSFVRH